MAEEILALGNDCAGRLKEPFLSQDQGELQNAPYPRDRRHFGLLTILRNEPEAAAFENPLAQAQTRRILAANFQQPA